MPVLKTWSVVGERWSRMESMKVMVPGVSALVKGIIFVGRGWRVGDYVGGRAVVMSCRVLVWVL